LFGHDCVSQPTAPARSRRPEQGAAVNALVVGILAGAFGMAYFVYGRRQSRVVPVVCGVMLCVYPWFIENPYALYGIGAALVAAPFLVDF
jgi:hypothetical protein